MVTDARRTQDFITQEMLKCIVDAIGLPRLEALTLGMCLGIWQRAMVLGARLRAAEGGDLRGWMCVQPKGIFEKNWAVNWEDEDVIVADRRCLFPPRHPRVRSKLPKRRLALVVECTRCLHFGARSSASTLMARLRGQKMARVEAGFLLPLVMGRRVMTRRTSRTWGSVPPLAIEVGERRAGWVRFVAPPKVAPPKVAPTAALCTAARCEHHGEHHRDSASAARWDSCTDRITLVSAEDFCHFNTNSKTSTTARQPHRHAVLLLPRCVLLLEREERKVLPLACLRRASSACLVLRRMWAARQMTRAAMTAGRPAEWQGWKQRKAVV